MKRIHITPLAGGLLVAAFLAFSPPTAEARGGEVQVIDAPIARYGDPQAVSVSTSAYTKVQPTTTLSFMTNLLIDNPSTNSSIMHGHIGNCTSTSISTSTVTGPIEIAPGSNGGEILVDNNSCVWLVSRNGASGAESVMIQPVSRRYGP